jgi:hypothetical protein
LKNAELRLFTSQLKTATPIRSMLLWPPTPASMIAKSQAVDTLLVPWPLRVYALMPRALMAGWLYHMQSKGASIVAYL